ncbi:ATP-dependent DNA ligase [Alsobacter sp. SYSU M60028]|uniref:DNA ligase (ATP) n=1 Tax=Alsobacter ponti TaxID=2962936 RepID=A0ABT1LGL7_9HYPH|nr:ATP-dependent DNA ligase [Alsobacter ponti]MCP8940226.1 ATP-dependent DNA ligase [Alsobacter ponti]
MEARLAGDLPDGPDWRFEPKWDGFRCLAFRSGDDVDLRAKSGKPLARYFPEMVAALRALPADRFVLDGELVIPQGDSLSFDALQMRLHPAESRVRKLAAQSPSVLIAFDLLAADGAPLTDRPLSERRLLLEAFMARLPADAPLRLSPVAPDRARALRWLDLAGDALDGVVAKRLDLPYAPGERAMVKVKRLRTADCVVGGFRFEAGKRTVGSLLLGLYDEAGLLDHVGFTSALSAAERAELTPRLLALVEPPGFTGKAPGGPSRWNAGKDTAWEPLRPELVVEVQFDQVTGQRFRHGARLVRWRPDKAPRQCTMEQLASEGRPARLIAELTET